MTLSGRLGSWWSYRKPSSAKQLIVSLISQRNFRVFLCNQVSRKRILKNGLPQGSVLAPSFFNAYISDLPPTNCVAEVWICWWLDLATKSKTFFTSWEHTVSWYRTPERVLWLLEAAPEHIEDSGDLLSPGKQTSCQKTESVTSGRRACTRLCTKVPRCDSW